MLAKGNSVVLEDVLDNVREATGVSVSPMVKVMAEVATPVVVLWFEILEIVGAVFGGA